MSEKWHKENPEYARAYAAMYRKKNPEKIAAYSKMYREKNRESLEEKSSKYRIQYPEKTKGRQQKWRLKQLGVTTEDYNKMFDEQNGKCAICGKHQIELKRPLHIDHCHKTKKVRGLLCSNCNTGIGLLQEDIENLRCAILYLNK